MRLDFAAWDGELIDTIQVATAQVLWMIGFARAWHRGADYLRVRTYPAGAANRAHVRIVGPYPDLMRALAIVQKSIRAALSTFTGAVPRPVTGVSAGAALAHR